MSGYVTPLRQPFACSRQGAPAHTSWFLHTRRGRHVRGRWWSVVISGLLSALLLSGCEQWGLEQTDIERIRARGSLRVLTRNAPVLFYEDQDQSAGFERDLAVSFAEYLGVPVQFVVEEDQPELLAGLRRGEGDLAAAGLRHSEAARREFRLGPAYQEVESWVVCREGQVPHDVMDLAGQALVVGVETDLAAQMDRLAGLAPNLTWRVDPERSTEQLLEEVAEGRIPCTVADSILTASNQREFPQLVEVAPLGAVEQLAWYLPRRAWGLQRQVEAWLGQLRRNGRLTALVERHFGGALTASPTPRAVAPYFHPAMGELAPAYQRHFEEAAQRTGLPWTLLAAVAYQESRWDPAAVSAEGVKGMMMLTRATARDYGVRNRHDARQSILAGANYLATLHRELPAEVQEPDRTWMALVAYNMGSGHLRDARGLARAVGKNPNHWGDLQGVLPLLSNPRFYERLPHGYARGGATVRFVRAIQGYQTLLAQGGGVRSVQGSSTPPAAPAPVELLRSLEQIARSEPAAPVASSAPAKALARAAPGTAR